MEKTSSKVWETIRFIIITLLIVIPIRAYVAQPFIVSGVSMAPSFENGEYLIIDELSYSFRSPERGEVIVFRYPRDPSKFFIKRIIGLPGETIKIRDGQVFIENNGSEERWNYPAVVTENFGENEIYQLGSGEYFVLGDNREMSLDSRVWGPVEENLIKGRVFLRLYPFNRLGVLPAAV